MSVNTLSNLSGVSTRTINTWESGDAQPDDEKLIRVGNGLQSQDAEVMRTSVEEFPAYFLALARRLLNERYVGQEVALSRRNLLLEAIRRYEGAEPLAPEDELLQPPEDQSTTGDTPDDESPDQEADGS